MKSGAVKSVTLFVLSTLLSMGIADVLGASGPRLTQSPSSAATPPSLEIPAGGATRDTAPGSPRNPGATPLPTPASTNHYADSAGNSSGHDHSVVLSESRRSISFFTTA